MRRLQILASSAVVFLLPIMASAQLTSNTGGGGQFELLLRNILNFSNTVLIPFIIGIGFLVFVWGMFQFFIAGGSNDEAKEKGKSLMIYATLGFVLIIVFWGVINLLTSSIGLQQQTVTAPKGVTLPNP